MRGDDIRTESGSPTRAFCRVVFLLFAVLLVAITAKGANAQSPDGRIILVDLPWFGQIGDEAGRRQAISDVISDIAMFEDEAPARVGTVVLAPRGPNIRVVANTIDGGETIAELQGSAEYLLAEDGGDGLYSPLTVQALREAVYAALRRLDFLGPKEPRVVDLHVFAAHWRLDRNDVFGDIMATEQATACILERSTVAEVWPTHVSLRVEFRIPEGAEAPSASAEAALIGVLTGYSTEVAHVATRGAAGPRCSLGEAETATGYIAPGMIDNPDCSRPPQSLRTGGETVQACRSAAPLAPAEGASLERLPVLLVARPEETVLSAPALGGTLLSGTDPIARVGAVEIRPGNPAPLGVAVASAPAQVELRPRDTCSPGQGGDLVLGQGAGGVTVAISRFACDAATLSLGEVGLR
jgi:hypothetical protein